MSAINEVTAPLAPGVVTVHSEKLLERRGERSTAYRAGFSYSHEDRHRRGIGTLQHQQFSLLFASLALLVEMERKGDFFFLVHYVSFFPKFLHSSPSSFSSFMFLFLETLFIPLFFCESVRHRGRVWACFSCVVAVALGSLLLFPWSPIHHMLRQGHGPFLQLDECALGDLLRFL